MKRGEPSGLPAVVFDKGGAANQPLLPPKNKSQELDFYNSFWRTSCKKSASFSYKKSPNPYRWDRTTARRNVLNPPSHRKLRRDNWGVAPLQDPLANEAFAIFPHWTIGMPPRILHQNPKKSNTETRNSTRLPPCFPRFAMTTGVTPPRSIARIIPRWRVP